MSADRHVGAAFPEGFLWGAATSSYQIEGAVRADGRGPSIWDTFSHTPGKTANGDTGDIAVDHYHRWHTDVALMRDLGLGAYRFSVAWPRVLPKGTGRVNAAGLDFYDRLVDGLLGAGIRPWLTLYHWDLPEALAERGGLTNRDVASAFEDYTAAVAQRLGDRVSDWITINEPMIAGFLGYWWGVHAPGHTDMAEGLAAVHNLLRMHGTALGVLREMVPGCRAGITLNLAQVYPEGDSEADARAAERNDLATNRWFLDPVLRGSYPEEQVEAYGDAMPEIHDDDMALISRPTDFLGINTYMPTYARADGATTWTDPTVGPDLERTATGWLVEPRALTDLLTRVHEDYAPAHIYITENGAAFDDPRPVDDRVHDPRRVSYYAGHIGACHDAIGAGVPLRGYFAWSLLDNFEWNSGYTVRFGIVHVDYATQERTPKDSARWYARTIEANAIADPDKVR